MATLVLSGGADALGFIEPRPAEAFAGDWATFETVVDVDEADAGELEVCAASESQRTIQLATKPHSRAKWTTEVRLPAHPRCAVIDAPAGEKASRWNGLDGVYDVRLRYRILAECSADRELVTIRDADPELQTGFSLALESRCLGHPVRVTAARSVGGGRMVLSIEAEPIPGVTYTVLAGDGSWTLRAPGGTIVVPPLPPEAQIEARVSFADGYSFRTPLYDSRNLSLARNESDGGGEAESTHAIPAPPPVVAVGAGTLAALVSRRKR